MKPWLISGFRPNRSIDLLLRANIAVDEMAAEAWRNWQRMRSIDDTNWLEQRLLTPLARRIATLDPRSPIRGRVEGLAKAIWTRTQLMLRDSVTALDALESAGIKYMLFKGAAYYAEAIGPATRRVMGDVDILVHPDAVVAACDRLCETGWSSKPHYPTEQLRRRVQIAVSGVAFQKGEFGKVDLHKQIYYFTRNRAELNANLWNNARVANFAGRRVLVPSEAESIVIGISDGIHSGEGDWVLDVNHRIKVGHVNWEEVLGIAVGRGLVPFVLAGLSYLRSLGSEVPPSTLNQLYAAGPTVGEYLKYWDFRMRRRHVSHRLRMQVRRLANVWLPKDQYQY